MYLLLGPIIFIIVPSTIAVFVLVCLMVAISQRSSVAFCLYSLMLVSSITVRMQVSNWNFCLTFIISSCSSTCLHPMTASMPSQELLEERRYLWRWTQYFYIQILFKLTSFIFFQCQMKHYSQIRMLLFTSAAVSGVLAGFYLFQLCKCTKTRSIGTQTGDVEDLSQLPGHKLSDHGWDGRLKTSKLVINYKK